jgi:hypothetical protein
VEVPNCKTAGLIWNPQPIAPIDLYEMLNLRLTIGGTKNLKTKRKPALKAETRRKHVELTEPEKKADPDPVFAFRGLTTKIRCRRTGYET